MSKQRIRNRKAKNDVAYQTRLAEEKQMKEDEEFNNKEDGKLPSRITDLFNLFSSGKSEKKEVYQSSKEPLPINKRGQLPHEEELRKEARKEQAEILREERAKAQNSTSGKAKKSLFGLFN